MLIMLDDDEYFSARDVTYFMTPEGVDFFEQLRISAHGKSCEVTGVICHGASEMVRLIKSGARISDIHDISFFKDCLSSDDHWGEPLLTRGDEGHAGEVSFRFPLQFFTSLNIIKHQEQKYSDSLLLFEDVVRFAFCLLATRHIEISRHGRGH